MEMALSLKDMGLILIGIGLIVLIGYCILVLKNLVVTIKHTNQILADTEVISGIAADKAKEVDKIIGDVSESIGSVADIIKGNQNVVQALTAIVNSIASIKNLIKHN